MSKYSEGSMKKNFAKFYTLTSALQLHAKREAGGGLSAASHASEFASALRFLAAARADAVAAADQVNRSAPSCQAV